VLQKFKYFGHPPQFASVAQKANGKGRLGVMTLSAWNGEGERRPGAGVRHCPQAPLMSLDNGTADGEADAHTASLRGVEGLEKPLRCLRFEADSGIFHAQAEAIALFSRCPDD